MVLLLLVAAARAAGAAPGESVTIKAACAESAVEGQRLRVRGKLRDSLTAFTACAAQRCPSLIRKDCSNWRAEVEAALPTVVVRAVAGEDTARELYDVEVQVDGAIVTRKLDGGALAVDPGEHTFGFRTAGSEPVTRQVVVRVGEKHRLIEVTLGTPAAPDTVATPGDPGAAGNKRPAPPQGTVVTEPAPPPPPRMTAASWILLGVGVAALGSAGYFGGTGWSDVKSLRDRCAPRCPQEDVDAARTKLLVADVSLAAGVVALASAGWLIFFRRPAAATTSASPPPPPVRVGLAPLPGGGMVGLQIGEARRW